MGAYGGTKQASQGPEHFSVVSEISGNYGTIFGEDVKVHQFLFGPRVSFRNDKTVVPFVQGLFGATHGSVGGSGGSVTFGESGTDHLSRLVLSGSL